MNICYVKRGGRGGGLSEYAPFLVFQVNYPHIKELSIYVRLPDLFPHKYSETEIFGNTNIREHKYSVTKIIGNGDNW